MFWCQWYLSKLYFYLYSLAEEQNKWKMFSHTLLGPGPKGLFWVMFCQLLFCCLPLLTEISEQESFFWGLSPIPFVVFLCCTMSAKKIRSKSQSGGIFIFYDSSETLLHYWQEILGLQKIYLLGILDFKFFIHKFLVWVYTRNDVSHVFFTDLTELCKISFTSSFQGLKGVS